MNATTTAPDHKQALADLGKAFFHLSIGRYEDNEFDVDHMTSDLALMHLTNKRQYAADHNI